MTKIVLNDVQGGFNLETINSNFNKIETALNEKVLYRTNPSGDPNVMNQTLDLNGYSIINVGSITSGGVPAPAPVLAEDVVFAPTGTISATNVQDAIVELMNEGSGSGGGGGTAASVSYTPTAPITGTNVQTAMDQIATLPRVSSFNSRTGAVTLTSADVTTALGFTPSAGGGSVTLLNVAALRAASSTGGTTVSTRGYYTNGDGGAADYYLDTTDTSSADDGGSVIVATDGGRWKLAKAITYSARQFGSKGDGVANDYPTLQAFATFLCINGKRGYIPGGKYKISQRIVFTNTCEIFGDGWKDVRDMTGPTTRDWSQAQIVGTIIYTDFTNTDTNHSSAFYFEGNSPIIRDMEFETLQPLPGPGWTSNNTPYALDFFRPPFYEQGANGIMVENIMLRNHKHGINMDGASRGTLRDIYGQCFGNAIQVTKCYDVLRMEDIHLNWPFYSGNSNVTSQMDLNGVGIALGRVDNPILHNVFIFGGNIGIKTFVDTGSIGGRTERMQITNMGLDNIAVGLRLEDSVTLDMSNFYVYCRNIANSRAVHGVSVLGGGQVPIRMNMSNGDFQGSQAEAMRFEVQGNVQLSNIRIRDYNLSAGSFPGIAVYDGVKAQYVNLVVETLSTTPITQAFGTGTITSGTGVNGVSSFNTRTGTVNLTSADVTTALGYTPASSSTSLFTGTVRSAGSTPLPVSGKGLEMLYDTGLDAAFLQSYDRTGSTYKDLNLAGLNVNFKSGTSGTTQAAFNTSGQFLLGYGSSVGSYKLQVNGDAIIGGAFLGTTATAGDSSTKFATTAFVQNAISSGSSSGNFATTIRSTASSAPSSGTGIEVNYDTGINAGFVNAYDRTNSVYKNLNLGGESIGFKMGTTGANAAFFDANGSLIINYGSTQGTNYKLQVNGDALISGAAFASTPSTATTGTRVATCDYVINKLSAASVTSFNSRTGAITLTSGDVTSALGYSPAGTSSPSFNGLVGNSGTFRSTSTSTPGSGVGLELNYDTGLAAGFAIAYNRSSSQYVPINLGGSTITFKAGTGGSNVAFFDTDGNLLIGYGSTNGSSYKLQVNSQIYATNATIATSDRRVKKDIKPLEDGLDVVMKLQPVTFNFKEHAKHEFSKDNQVGFIAQDIEQVLDGKEYVKSVVATNEDGDENLKGIADTKLIPILVKAIQELKAEIEVLKGNK
jgi:hypothetical protein